MAAPKPSGFSTTKAGKTKILERTKELLAKSSMVISIPFEGVSKEDTDILRKTLPEGVQASMVKNALMRKSVTDTPFSALAENLKQESMFFFVPEGLSKPGYEAFKKWQKEIKRIEPEHAPRALATEGQTFAGKKLEYVVNLPSKLELIAQLARTLKAPSTRLARAIKAVPNKLGRALRGVHEKKLEESTAVPA